MEISVKDFKEALEIVKPGLSVSQTTIEHSTSFAFTKKNVITYNDEICITHPLADLDMQGAIESELLYKYLSKLKSSRVTLEINESEVTLKSGRSKATFMLDSEIKLPLDDEQLITKGKWKELPKEFIEAVTMAKECASKDTIRAKLNCVHINKAGFIESSDGFRILRYTMPEKLPVKTVLIPVSSMNAVIRIKPTQVAKGKEWIHFRNKAGTVISCRVLDEEFVSTEEYLKDGKDGSKLEFPKELIDSLDTAAIFAENFMVKITIDKKKLTISSNSQLATYNEVIESKSKMAPFAFQITPYLLKDILKQITSCTIYKDKMIFKNENWRYMTTLNILEE